MQLKFLISFSLLICLILHVGSFADASEREKQIIQKNEKQLSETTDLIDQTHQQAFSWDYGGWLNFRYDNYNDSDNDRTARDSLDHTWQTDLRSWINLQYRPLQNEKNFILQSYFRVKSVISDQRPEDIAGGYDIDHIELDNGFFRITYQNLEWSIGRQYYSIGRGISYSDIHDGTELLVATKNFDFQFLATHTKPYEDNIDSSVPGYQHDSSRYFYGTQVTTYIKQHQVYSYILYQKDESDEHPIDTANQYGYDSVYLGLGLEGNLSDKLSYWNEVIYEFGESYIYGTNKTKLISAWAADIGIEIENEKFFKKIFSIEYGIASGDSSRSNVSNTLNGNSKGKDTNFLSFGYQPTGIVLAPQFSNLQFYRLGGIFYPFDKNSFLNLDRFEFYFDFFHFLKANNKSAVSDFEATKSNFHIGFEIDLGVSYEITSDLSFNFEFGRFYPGAAYSATVDDPETFLSFSTTLQF